ncbi:serine/arginine-rich splicing factor 4 isoform X1 [Solanum tuberosum]|uniref:serine/arginine-rich splicing factor 4 isoform X1 n=1 Tax=Solanum tuberosum TaxID=4113 RepID=UPI00073A1C6C|nr:PREDICTED: serine/arginine-rich splicing factor 4 isoform X1 [Solanum tuberosum]
MEEEKAAAYYDDLTRKGEGAARFKQGLGFSSTSNDAVPIRGSALVSSSSFLSSFVRASSPSKTTEFEKQAQLQTIQNKLKKKPKDNKDCLSSRISKGKSTRSTSPSREKRSSRRSPSPTQKLRRRSRSRSRDKERHSRRSENRDAYRSKRPHMSRSRSRSRSRDRDKQRKRERQKEKQSTTRTRSVSPRDGRPEKVGKDRAATVDYSKLIEGYQNMTPAERVKAKMKFQLSESVRKDETKSMGSGWERFDFDKDAPLDDNEIEAVEDDGALVNHIGKSFRFSTVEMFVLLIFLVDLKTRREEQIKAAHDEAIFGAPSHLPRSPSTETDDEAEDGNGKKDISEIAPATSLISGKAVAMQQGSWRDRLRKS